MSLVNEYEGYCAGRQRHYLEEANSLRPDEEDRVLWKVVLMSMLSAMVAFFFTDSALVAIVVMLVFAVIAAIKISNTPRRK